MGFEPTARQRRTTVFETAPINHSGTPPGRQPRKMPLSLEDISDYKGFRGLRPHIRPLAPPFFSSNRGDKVSTALMLY